MELTAIVMNEMCVNTAFCPHCGGPTTVTATVDAGQWEREFFRCRECDFRFAGSWCSAQLARVRVDESFARPAVTLPAA